jgi:rare lipoprotein A (peptidoglycan hydrolase)
MVEVKPRMPPTNSQAARTAAPGHSEFGSPCPCEVEAPWHQERPALEVAPSPLTATEWRAISLLSGRWSTAPAGADSHRWPASIDLTVRRLQELGDRIAGEALSQSQQRDALAREALALERCVEGLLACVESFLQDETATGSGELVRPADRVTARGPATNLAETLRLILERVRVLKGRVLGPALTGRVGYATMAAALSVSALVSSPVAVAGPPGSMPEAPNGAQTIVVAPGDTLQKISLRHYGSPGYVQQIAEANGIANPDFIRAGTLLTLPAMGSGAEVAVPAVETVMVHPGDTLVAISQRAYGTPAYAREIAAANGIANPSLIRTGWQLRLPAVQQAQRAKISSAAPPAQSVNRQPVRGVATYYGIEDGFVDGTMACGEEFSPSDATVVAVKPGRYPCGTRLTVTNPDTQQSVNVVVKDYCGGCAWDHLDLSRAAFSRIGPIKQGRLNVAWAPSQ